jgi:hypothetical protein
MSTGTTTLNSGAAPRAYSSFSPGRIWTIATNTFTQLLRMKILVFLAVFAVIVLVFAFGIPTVLSVEQQFSMLNNGAFGALQFFSIVIAIAATALLIPRDVEDRTLYTILCKPVPRHEYLVGKLLGVVLLLGAGLVVMDLIFCGVLWLKQTMVAQAYNGALQAAHKATPENLAQVRDLVASFNPTWSLHAGLWCVFLKSCVMASMALLMSCIASSTLFTIIVSLCFSIAGQGQGLLRSFVLKSMTVTWKKVISFIIAIICPDLTLFDMVDAAVRGATIPVFYLAQITGFAVLYIVLYTAVAYLFFAEKEL